MVNGRVGAYAVHSSAVGSTAPPPPKTSRLHHVREKRRGVLGKHLRGIAIEKIEKGLERALFLYCVCVSLCVC